MKKERWKNCKYNSDFIISNKGKVYSKKRENIDSLGIKRIIGGKYLKFGTDSTGHKRCAFKCNNKHTTFKVHRLVAQHFINNPENKPCINHKDGNPANNDVDNLEWVTWAENIQHAYNTGLIKTRRDQRGLKNNMCKYKPEQIKFIREYKKKHPKVSQQHIADITGIDRRYVGHILQGVVWSWLK